MKEKSRSFRSETLLCKFSQNAVGAREVGLTGKVARKSLICKVKLSFSVVVSRKGKLVEVTSVL